MVLKKPLAGVVNTGHRAGSRQRLLLSLRILWESLVDCRLNTSH